MRIFAFHDGHACGYYRILLPIDALRDLGGHEVMTSCGWDEAARQWPIVIGQRIGGRDGGPTAIWRRLAADHALVYETDDDLWTIDPTNFWAHRQHDAVLLDDVEQAMAVSRLVTVSTEALAEVCRQFNDNVVVLENRIDARMLDLERPRRERLTVGWAGGDSHLRDMQMLAPQLKRFLQRNPEVDFHVIGDAAYQKALEIPGRNTRWQANIWDYYRALDFDIGVAPLIESPFNRSKSAIKALEYAALGIPVIASDVEPYRAFVEHGVTGFLVRREHEWGRYLYQLSKDTAMREEMGRKAKAKAARWTIQENWPAWERAFQSLERRSSVCA